ncbi:hypothetical protein ACLB1Q_12410 [Escherichia coli]
MVRRSLEYHISLSSLYIPESWQSFSHSGKTNFRTPFHPQPVAECGGTRAIPEQTTFEQMVARAAALTATPQVDKVVLSRLIDMATTPPLIVAYCWNG